MAPLVFISCGQYTEQEKRLGKAVAAIVKGFGFEPYFAETQSSLSGLHSNILNKLNECAALISIMHDRGKVSGLDGTSHSRGSVWIEQEIAVAAFITHTLNRKIEVACFISKEIKREGIRDLLHLNPVPFADNGEILEHLPAILGKWVLENPAKKQIAEPATMQMRGPYGYYFKEGDDVPFCPKCWEGDGKAIHLPPLEKYVIGPGRICRVCKHHYTEGPAPPRGGRRQVGGQWS
jgi:hypothetical protein